jgi:hypothetical protein
MMKSNNWRIKKVISWSGARYYLQHKFLGFLWWHTVLSPYRYYTNKLSAQLLYVSMRPHDKDRGVTLPVVDYFKE